MAVPDSAVAAIGPHPSEREETVPYRPDADLSTAELRARRRAIARAGDLRKHTETQLQALVGYSDYADVPEIVAELEATIALIRSLLRGGSEDR